jgi:hypothetical protein
LYFACQKVGPDLAAAAKRYTELIYISIVGEKETFLDNYPALR